MQAVSRWGPAERCEEVTHVLDRDAERRMAFSAMAGEFTAVGNDVGRLVALAARRVSEVFGELCVIHLLGTFAEQGEAGTTLYHARPHMLAAARDLGSTFLRVGGGLVGRVAETGDSVLIEALDREAFLADLAAAERAAFERLGINSLVAAPLSTDGQAGGVMLVTGSDPERPLHAPDLRLVEDMASRLARLLARARAASAERGAHDALLGARRSLRESDEAHRL